VIRRNNVTFICLIMVLFITFPLFAQGKTINYMVAGGSPFSEAVLKLLPEFEKESGIKVNVIELPYEQTYAKGLLEARNETGTYDVIQINRPSLAAYAEPNYLVPLNDLVSEDLINDLFPVHKDYVTFNGKVYAIPHSNDLRALYFRTDMFKEAGIGNPPDNWDQMRDYAKKFTNEASGEYGLLLAGSPKGPGVWVMSDFIHQAGGSILDENGKPAINSKEAISGLTFFVDLLTKDKVIPPGTPNYLWMDIRTLFPQGKSAMVQEFNDIIPLLDDPKTSLIIGKYDLSLIPGNVRKGTNNAGWLVAIPKGCKNLNEAAKLIEFIMSSRAQIEMCKVSGTLSARISVLAELINSGDATLPKGNPDSKSRWDFYKSVVETAYELPRTPYEPEIETIMGEALSEALGGLVSPEDALNEAQERIIEVLK
jgi:multiple sugar transport system substrate-binding protein